ncbi:hypothetical protein DXG01_011524 [Tephrocybe rancida]|nr:hypothetical protein DXG01_011524 [Tephrocybe rancida]
MDLPPDHVLYASQVSILKTLVLKLPIGVALARKSDRISEVFTNIAVGNTVEGQLLWTLAEIKVKQLIDEVNHLIANPPTLKVRLPAHKVLWFGGGYVISIRA